MSFWILSNEELRLNRLGGDEIRKQGLYRKPGRRIGKAICLALAPEGSDVLTADIEPGKAHGVSREIRTRGRK